MRPPRAPAILASLLVLLGSGLFAFARMAPADGRTLSYQGRLELNGSPLDDVHDFRFGLFSTSGADASCLAAASISCAGWAEEQLGVGVSAGQFAVRLGESVAISDAELASNALYLAIAVKAPTDTAYTLLAGKHEILPVPWAARAAAAKDYKVTGTLSVGDGIDVTGGVSASGDVSAGGHVSAGGDLTALGAVRGSGIWEKIYETTLATAADHTVTGLDGNADRRYQIVLQGFLSGTGAVNHTIGVRPNGATSGYSGLVQSWHGHVPGTAFVSQTSTTGLGLTGKEVLPIAVNHWTHDGSLSATAELFAATGMTRVIHSHDAFNSANNPQRIIHTTHANAWLDTTTNITSLTFTFNGAADFDGLITIYRMR